MASTMRWISRSSSAPRRRAAAWARSCPPSSSASSLRTVVCTSASAAGLNKSSLSSANSRLSTSVRRQVAALRHDVGPLSLCALQP
ncbi:hypothetical protein [Variovorax boronicumulans]|uniref:hypothetical protein n=1 Tax=Variovorax boronicumulans TaxID=436515 RepID=UPI001F0B3A49|nr:hypothetical protein [Variovorax boronicumulans]